MEYLVGLSLAQAPDTTGYALVRREWYGREHPLPENVNPGAWHHTICDLHRFSVGSTYDEIAQGVVLRLEQSGIVNPPVVIDITGVGESVIKRVRLSLRENETHEIRLTAQPRIEKGENWETNLPKVEMVTVLQIALQQKRLKIPKTLPEVETLVRELGDFRYKPKLAGPMPAEVEWRPGRNDDLVFAVALAIWQGDRYPLTRDIGVYVGKRSRGPLHDLYDCGLLDHEPLSKVLERIAEGGERPW
jgi:hypothetical protein